MDLAKRTANLSTAKRLKVGAILVKNDNIIGFSYNGTPSGWDNNCEERVWMPPDAGGWLDVDQIEKQWPYEEYSDEISSEFIGRYKLQTKQEVSHAEENLIMKLSCSPESSEGSVMFVTHNPCYVCSRLIYGAKINHVIYDQDYRDSSGLDFLKKCGIKVEKYEERYRTI